MNFIKNLKYDWQRQSKVDKIIFIIVIALLIVFISYLIYKIVKRRDREREIEGLQKNYTRFHFTYVAFIKDISKPADKFECLGAVLSETLVVTLASCVNEERKYEVIVGKYFIDREDKYEYNVSVQTIRKHPKYESNPSKYNYALLITDEPVGLGESVCVAYVGNTTFDHTAVVHGWGKRFDTPSSNEAVHMRTTTFKVNKNYCDKHHPPICKKDLIPKFKKKYCVGNIGSPIVQEMYPRHILIGLALTPYYPCYKDNKPPEMIQTRYFKNLVVENDPFDKKGGKDISKSVQSTNSPPKSPDNEGESATGSEF